MGGRTRQFYRTARRENYLPFVEFARWLARTERLTRESRTFIGSGSENHPIIKITDMVSFLMKLLGA